MVCNGCAGWVDPVVDVEGQTVRCPECGHEEPVRIVPLFVLTGTSAGGKTAVIPPLRRLLPEWEIFETDILWDSQGDWHFVRCNWLRIAHSIAQSGRPTILCGTHLPEHLDACDHRRFFHPVHYLALYCDEETLVARLRARPAWRGCTEDFVQGQREFGKWLLENRDTAFDPPLVILDTSRTPLEETACDVRDWAVARWPFPAKGLG